MCWVVLNYTLLTAEETDAEELGWRCRGSGCPEARARGREHPVSLHLSDLSSQRADSCRHSPAQVFLHLLLFSTPVPEDGRFPESRHVGNPTASSQAQSVILHPALKRRFQKTCWPHSPSRGGKAASSLGHTSGLGPHPA